MGQPILSPGKKLTGKKFWPVIQEGKSGCQADMPGNMAVATF